MTQEDKLLLLIDICGRLPYNPIVTNPRFNDEKYPTTLSPYSLVIGKYLDSAYIDDTKIYLRPMSSMTEEEKFEYDRILSIEHEGYLLIEEVPDIIDFYNSKHLDYRDLIPMGLALEAPEGMYNKEESEKGGEIPIPKTVDEAISTLEKILSDEDREYLLKNGASSVHDSLGRWIRNEWGLWADSELKNELKKKGFEHPDDMSNYIIEEFIKYLNNKI